MRELISFLLTVLSSLFMGIDYIAPTDKVYNKSAYYQQELNPHDVTDKELYNRSVTSMNVTGELCNKEVKTFDQGTTGRNTISFGSNQLGHILPFTAPDGSDPKALLSKAKKIDSLDAYIIEVPNGTEIVAPMNCNLVPNSVLNNSVYPKNGGETLGVCMQVQTETLASTDVSFKITIGSLERTWCCLAKSKPSSYADAEEGKEGKCPKYQHTVKFDEATTFPSGSILGVAGRSGVPRDSYGSDKSYLIIKVEKIENGESKSIEPVKMYDDYTKKETKAE